MSRATRDEYASIGGGSLKLKGIKGSKVDKRKKRKHKKTSLIADEEQTSYTDQTVKSSRHEGARSQLLNSLQPDPNDGNQDRQKETDTVNGQGGSPEGAGFKVALSQNSAKTAAETRHEERRRKMLSDRLKREGTRTHKERVEELNKYLSGLSEHHDMPRIGPG